MTRLLAWCVPDKALRWGWLTRDPLHYRIDRFWKQELERIKKIETKYLDAREPQPPSVP